MARLTAAQVQQMLYPVAQFAPAVHAAQDILASVEQAEKDHQALIAARDGLQSQIADLQRQQVEYQARVTQAKNEFAVFQTKIEAQKQELLVGVGPLQAEQTKLREETQKLQAARDEQAKLLGAEKASWDKRVADAQKRYEDFKNKL